MLYWKFIFPHGYPGRHVVFQAVAKLGNYSCVNEDVGILDWQRVNKHYPDKSFYICASYHEEIDIRKAMDEHGHFHIGKHEVFLAVCDYREKWEDPIERDDPDAPHNNDSIQIGKTWNGKFTAFRASSSLQAVYDVENPERYGEDLRQLVGNRGRDRLEDFYEYEKWGII